jgi:hypothetical protein
MAKKIKVPLNVASGRNGGEEFHLGEVARMNTRIVEVTTESQYWIAKRILKEIFSDPTDLEPDDALEKFFLTPQIARYILFEQQGTFIGVELARVNPLVGTAMYVPYMGTLPRFRGAIHFSEMKRIVNAQMRMFKVPMLLVDVEDPARIEGVYPDEDQNRIIEFCKERLRWFQRGFGTSFIDDPALPYCRPASDNPTEDVQAYDILGFVPVDPDDPELSKWFSDDRKMVRIELYEALYVALMQLEYGTQSGMPTAAELRDRYPAIEKFLGQLEDYRREKQWVTLRPLREGK